MSKLRKRHLLALLFISSTGCLVIDDFRDLKPPPGGTGGGGGAGGSMKCVGDGELAHCCKADGTCAPGLHCAPLVYICASDS